MNKKQSAVVVDLGTGSQTDLLPLSVGYVLAYSADQEDLKAAYDFHIHFLDRDPAKLAGGSDPAVVGIACHVWNVKKALKFAKGLRELHPDTLILIGGYAVPSFPERIRWARI